jgi:hypothetical protein
MFSTDHILCIDAFIAKLQGKFPSLSNKNEIYNIAGPILGIDFEEKKSTEITFKKQKLSSSSGCDAILVRHATRKGQPCGAPVLPGLDKCEKHVKQNGKKPEPKATKTESTELVKAESKKKIIQNIQLKTKPVLQRLIDQRLKFAGIMNERGKYVHQGTGFVIDPSRLIVVGTEEMNRDGQYTGKIAPLSYEQVQFCLQQNIRFDFPSNFTSAEDQPQEKRATESLEEDDDIAEEDYEDEEEGDEN